MIQKDHITSNTDLTAIHLHFIRSRCAEETERFFRRQENDPRFCFELFRRAILQRDGQAWEYVYTQYQPLVASWVDRHSLFQALDEDREFLVNRVFEKMWLRLTPEKFALAAGLSAVLSYLHKCVNSVLVDTMRGYERLELFPDEGEEYSVQQALDPAEPEDQVAQRDLAERLWGMLQERCKDEKERAIAYGSFVLALKPSEIFTEFPKIFRNVQEVYRVKENFLARLKRDQELVDFLGE